MKTYIIRPGKDLPLGNLNTDISNLDRSKDWRITVGEDKESRSNKQNRLQWLWHTEYGKHFGHTKEYAYCNFKYKYVLPIMLRDEENTQLQRLWSLVRGDKDAIAALVHVIHTGDLDTSQMAEALTEYDRDTATYGLVFSDPEDLKMKAMIYDSES